MIYIFFTVHVLTCLFLIMVVLLQQGKGADLSVFGGGSTQAAFGARGAATLLHKLTVICFIIFIFTTLSIGILQRSGRSSSVMSGMETPATEQAAPAAAEPATPAGDATTPAEEPAAAPAPADAGADEAPAPADGAPAGGAEEPN